MFYITLFSILVSTWMIGKCYGKMSGIKAIVLGTTNYFFFYILCSALLFWVDYYSIKKAVVGTGAAVVVFAVIFACIFKQKVKFFLRKRELYALLLMCLLTLPLTTQKFGFFGMGQDQGVYQTKAIELINGNNQRIFDFWEYETLVEEDKETYRANIEVIAGLDQIDQGKPGLEGIDGVTDVAGIYHGIPTYPAILAMFAKFFGLSHMMDCQTVFLLLMLMIVYYILENFRVKYWLRLLSMTILGLSPEILWVSKSSLTEMFLAVILTTYVMMLTDKKELVRFFSFLPVAVFGVFHVSAFTVMPLVVVLYWLLYYVEREKITYIASCILSIVAYVLGFLFMIYISPTYTTNNYLNRVAFIDDGMLVPIVLMISTIALTATMIYALLLRNRHFCKLLDKIWYYRTVIYKGTVALLLLYVVVSSLLAGKTVEEIPNIGVVAVAIATGIMLVPVSILKIFALPKENITKRNQLVIYLSFAYGILFYYGILRSYVRDFYYYGRYMVPYLFIAVVMFAVLFNKTRRRYVIMICIVGICSFVPPVYYLCTNMDDTRLEWEVLEQTMEEIDGYNSAVILGEKTVKAMALPIASLGCDIYFVTDDILADVAKIEDKYQAIYYITMADESLGTKFSVQYKQNTFSYMDYQKELYKFSKYPVEYTKEDKTVTIYQYRKSRNVYDINHGIDFLTSGFGSIEPKVAWTNKEKSEITCYVDKKDYQVTLKQGAKVPLKELGFENYKIAISVNNEYLDTVIIDADNNGGELHFFIPKEMLFSGQNSISFTSELWSPVDYGQKDARKLGFGFRTLTFQEK